MSRNEDVSIDKYPHFEEKKLRKLDDKAVVRRIAFSAIDYFNKSDENGIVTWVDSEESWDGHALALQTNPKKGISMMYLHVNRQKERLVQQSLIELDVFKESDIEGDIDETDELLEKSAIEFDRKSLTYTYAMLRKIACLGVERVERNNDKIVMNVLFDENLNNLAELFPAQEKNIILPYASDEFREAIRRSAEVENIDQGGHSIYLRRSFSKDETYIMGLAFFDGELRYGQFIRHANDEVYCDLHDYEQQDSEPLGFEYEWDEEKLIRTVETGLSISEEAFEVYLKEALGAGLDEMYGEL